METDKKCSSMLSIVMNEPDNIDKLVVGRISAINSIEVEMRLQMIEKILKLTEQRFDKISSGFLDLLTEVKKLAEVVNHLIEEK